MAKYSVQVEERLLHVVEIDVESEHDITEAALEAQSSGVGIIDTSVSVDVLSDTLVELTSAVRTNEFRILVRALSAGAVLQQKIVDGSEHRWEDVPTVIEPSAPSDAEIHKNEPEPGSWAQNAKTKYQIGKEAFQTKKDIRRRISGIFDCPLGTVIDGADRDFLVGLIEYHPESTFLLREGIDYLSVQPGDRSGKREFVINTSLGNKRWFSTKRCVDNIPV